MFEYGSLEVYFGDWALLRRIKRIPKRPVRPKTHIKCNKLQLYISTTIYNIDFFLSLVAFLSI